MKELVDVFIVVIRRVLVFVFLFHDRRTVGHRVGHAVVKQVFVLLYALVEAHQLAEQRHVKLSKTHLQQGTPSFDRVLHCFRDGYNDLVKH